MIDHNKLTPREKESLKYMALPFSVASKKMHISKLTYKTYMARCFEKTFTHSRIQLLLEVLKRGYIKFEDIEIPDIWANSRAEKF